MFTAVDFWRFSHSVKRCTVYFTNRKGPIALDIDLFIARQDATLCARYVIIWKGKRGFGLVDQFGLVP
jgi:hypothetical protein